MSGSWLLWSFTIIFEHYVLKNIFDYIQTIFRLQMLLCVCIKKSTNIKKGSWISLQKIANTF